MATRPNVLSPVQIRTFPVGCSQLLCIEPLTVTLWSWIYILNTVPKAKVPPAGVSRALALCGRAGQICAGASARSVGVSLCCAFNICRINANSTT